MDTVSRVYEPTLTFVAFPGDWDNDGAGLTGEVSTKHTRLLGDVGRLSLVGDTAAAADACLPVACLGGVVKPAFSHRPDRQHRPSRHGRLQRCCGRKFGHK